MSFYFYLCHCCLVHQRLLLISFTQVAFLAYSFACFCLFWLSAKRYLLCLIGYLAINTIVGCVPLGNNYSIYRLYSSEVFLRALVMKSGLRSDCFDSPGRSVLSSHTSSIVARHGWGTVFGRCTYSFNDSCYDS